MRTRHSPSAAQKPSSQSPCSKKPWREQNNKEQPPKDLPGEDWPWKIKTILGRMETMVTSHLDRHIPDRCQYTNHGEHQYQSTYTNQNRSYTNNYNRNYRHTWENHTDRTCNNCGTKGHIAKYCTKTSFWCQWCHTATHDTQACRSKPRSSTPMESPSAGSYHLTQSPNQHNTSSHQPVPAHTTQPSPAPSGSKEWAKLLVTHMEEQEYNNRN